MLNQASIRKLDSQAILNEIKLKTQPVIPPEKRELFEVIGNVSEAIEQGNFNNLPDFSISELEEYMSHLREQNNRLKTYLASLRLEALAFKAKV